MYNTVVIVTLAVNVGLLGSKATEKEPNCGCYRNEHVLEFLLPCLKEKTFFLFKFIGVGISWCLFFSAYSGVLIIVELEIFVY